MDLRDCLEAVRDLLSIQCDREQDRALRVFRRLIDDGAPPELAAQAMVDSHHFERSDVLHAIETVLGRDAEEARQLLTEGRFTSRYREKNTPPPADAP